LSYGDSDYINEIIIQGKNLLGERFIPLKEFLKPEEYFKILKQVDVSIMNHNRQQASSNMSILLYLGKKLYAKEHISTAREFKRLGVKLFNVSELRKINFEQLIKMNDEDKEKNKRIIFEYFSDEKILMYLKAIFK
jgi:dTDP-N-acetylfucosamine:lipid II N-acetylfucosaminyltransferase